MTLEQHEKRQRREYRLRSLLRVAGIDRTRAQVVYLVDAMGDLLDRRDIDTFSTSTNTLSPPQTKKQG